MYSIPSDRANSCDARDRMSHGTRATLTHPRAYTRVERTRKSARDQPRLNGIPPTTAQGNRRDTISHLCEICGNLSILLSVDFVADQQSIATWVGMLSSLQQPRFDMVKRGLVSHVKYHNDSMCPSIVAASNGSESLLTCGVPLRTVDSKHPIAHRQFEPKPTQCRQNPA